MSLVYAAVGVHVGVYGPTAGVCVDVCGLNYHQRPGRGLWSVLLPEGVSRSLGCAASGDMLIWEPMLPPRVMSGSVVLLQSGSVLMFIACAITKGLANHHELCCSLKLC